MEKLRYEVLFFPGNYFTTRELSELTESLRNVAAKCFEDVPNYQVLTGHRNEYRRAVISVAKDRVGKIVGFCSSLVLDIGNEGRLLHLGLTCVSPKQRGKRLTHKLSSKLLLQYLLREAPINGTWISNCACVLSSLGNVALYFEDVFPSPFSQKAPSASHLAIAYTISNHYRRPIAINEAAVFNEKKFVFEGSVENTVFEKSERDSKYFHRNKYLTDFYQGIINFSRGDEVLQIGKLSLLSFPKYIMNKKVSRLKLGFNHLGQNNDDYVTE